MKIPPRPALLAVLLVLAAPFASAAESVSPNPTAAVAVPALAPLESENGYLKLGFDRLASFVFVPPAPEALEGKAPAKTGAEQIPSEVKSWSGKKVLITGFMLPVKMEKGLATEFLVMRNTVACCFGGTPSVTEWVVVKMKKGGAPLIMDLPAAFYGELKVGPVYENGYLGGIYHMECERVTEVKS